MSAERRLEILESKVGEVKPGLTEAQELAQDRYVTLLVRRQPIPPRLRAAFKNVPPEEPPGPGVLKMISDVMEGVGVAGERKLRRAG